MKQPPLSNLPSYEAETFTLTSSLEEGLVFLHIEITKFDKATLKDLQKSMEDFKTGCHAQGYDVVFATTPYERTVRFWGLVEPCYKIVPLEDSGWLGSWLTKEI